MREQPSRSSERLKRRRPLETPVFEPPVEREQHALEEAKLAIDAAEDIAPALKAKLRQRLDLVDGPEGSWISGTYDPETIRPDFWKDLEEARAQITYNEPVVETPRSAQTWGNRHRFPELMTLMDQRLAYMVGDVVLHEREIQALAEAVTYRRGEFELSVDRLPDDLKSEFKKDMAQWATRKFPSMKQQRDAEGEIKQVYVEQVRHRKERLMAERDAWQEEAMKRIKIMEQDPKYQATWNAVQEIQERAKTIMKKAEEKNLSLKKVA